METKSYKTSLLAFLLLVIMGCIQARSPAGSEIVNVTINQGHSNAMLGGSVRFAVGMTPAPSKGTVTWRHKGNIRVKIAELRLDANESLIHTATPFTGRSHVFPDYSLKIENLTGEDAGEYTVTLSIGAWEPTASVHLHVFEPIRWTMIRTENVSSTNQSCVASFSCSTEGGSTVSYTWRTGAQLETVLGTKEQLQVSLNSSSILSTLVCIASNPVSSQNATVNLTTTCVVKYPETAQLSSGPFSISVVSFGGCFFLLLAAGIIYWTHRSRRSHWVNRAPVSVSSQKRSMEGQHQENKDHVPQTVTQQTESAVPPKSPSTLNDAEPDYCEVQTPSQTSNSAVETEV